MTTLRQIQANQRNAQKSTGPRSDDGKAHSRANALKHGTAGAGIVLLDLDAQKRDERLQSWRRGYILNSVEDEWTFEQLIIATVQIDAAQDRQFKIRADVAMRAVASWDADRNDEISKIVAGIRRHPERVFRKLLCSKHGCQWLIDQWNGLGALLQVHGTWTPDQLQSAFDLLGTPLEFRVGTPWNDDETPAQLVAREVEQLQSRIDENLEILDQLRRDMAAQGHDPEPNPELNRLRRYEEACMRRYTTLKAKLKTRSIPADESLDSTPEPTPELLHEPEPEMAPEPIPTTPSSTPDPRPNPAPTPSIAHVPLTATHVVPTRISSGPRVRLNRQERRAAKALQPIASKHAFA